jgi:DNA-binding transcriptional MerR regulator
MSKSIERGKALSLRRQGMSIKDISIAVGVSKGSVSLWCQDIKLTSLQSASLKQKQIDAGHRGRVLGAQKNKQNRLDAIELAKKHGRNTIGNLSDRDLMMLGIGLYWGEGVKSRSGQTAVVNSDSNLLKVAKLWLQKSLGVSPSDIRPYVYISEQHRTKSKVIIEFWSDELKIPLEQFHAPIVIKQKPTKRYSNHDFYHGVVALRVIKSTNLKYKIKGLIDACVAD